MQNEEICLKIGVARIDETPSVLMFSVVYFAHNWS